MTDGVDLKEFLSGFLVEAEEHLASANRHLLAAEDLVRAGQAPVRQVRELFRSLHTIKGLASMVGVEPIVEISHEMESVLRRTDRSGGRLEPGAVEVLLAGVRAIEERVAQLGRGEKAQKASRDLLSRIAALTPDLTTSAAAGMTLSADLESRLSPSEREQLAQGVRGGQRAVSIDFFPSPQKAQGGFTITTVRERLASHGELVKVVPRSVPQSADAPGGLAFLILLLTSEGDEPLLAALGGPPATMATLDLGLPTEAATTDALTALEEEAVEATPLRKGLVRVDVHRLDDALEKLTALVVTRHRLSRAVAALAERGVEVRELTGIVADTGRQLRDLRGAIMTARMVPVSEVLERVPLIVRGLTRTTGKPLRLELDTGRAEVDKAVGERIFPAIIHLVRNAVDHGIEGPEERGRRGKPLEGLIRVSSSALGSHALEVIVADDGRGVDVEAVANRAGIPVPQTPAEILALLTRPGLSTRAEADHTSGRGMGMDIVRRTVEQLGGELTLVSRPGEGTTFTLRVPLSITIIDAFTFATGTQLFAVPVSAVEEIVEVDPAQVVDAPSPRGQRRGRGRLLQRRGSAVPLVGLGDAFGLGDADREVRKALIVRRDDEPWAFGVQRMLGQQDVVVRPIEDPLVKVPGVTGSTDLGDGTPTLVVDLVAISSQLAAALREVP